LPRIRNEKQQFKYGKNDDAFSNAEDFYAIILLDHIYKKPLNKIRGFFLVQTEVFMLNEKRNNEYY
jgi:hypothetical protein